MTSTGGIRIKGTVNIKVEAREYISLQHLKSVNVEVNNIFTIDHRKK
jgi:hypothetical protein